MEKKTQFSLWYFAFALVAVLFVHDLWVGARDTAPIPYSQFQTLVREARWPTSRSPTTGSRAR